MLWTETDLMKARKTRYAPKGITDAENADKPALLANIKPNVKIEMFSVCK